MNDVIASKRSSLIPKLIEAAMFLKLNMSLNPNNPMDVMESPIWNTLIPSCLELPDDIDDFDENEEEDDDVVMTMMMKMMIYLQCLSKMRKPTIRVDFKPFNFLV